MLEKFSSSMRSRHGWHGGEPSAYQFSHQCARSTFQFNVVGEHGSCCCCPCWASLVQMVTRWSSNGNALADGAVRPRRCLVGGRLHDAIEFRLPPGNSMVGRGGEPGQIFLVVKLQNWNPARWWMGLRKPGFSKFHRANTAQYLQGLRFDGVTFTSMKPHLPGTGHPRVAIVVPRDADLLTGCFPAQQHSTCLLLLTVDSHACCLRPDSANGHTTQASPGLSNHEPMSTRIGTKSRGRRLGPASRPGSKMCQNVPRCGGECTETLMTSPMRGKIPFFFFFTVG